MLYFLFSMFIQHAALIFSVFHLCISMYLLCNCSDLLPDLIHTLPYSDQPVSIRPIVCDSRTKILNDDEQHLLPILASTPIKDLQLSPSEARAKADRTLDADDLTAIPDDLPDNIPWLPEFNLFTKEKEMLNSKTE